MSRRIIKSVIILTIKKKKMPKWKDVFLIFYKQKKQNKHKQVLNKITKYF